MNKYRFLVKGEIEDKEYSYIKLEKPQALKKEYDAVLIPSLKSEFFITFPKVKMVISARGSKLAHLAILAREASMPVLKVKPAVYEKAKKEGSLKLGGDTISL